MTPEAVVSTTEVDKAIIADVMVVVGVCQMTEYTKEVVGEALNSHNYRMKHP